MKKEKLILILKELLFCLVQIIFSNVKLFNVSLVAGLSFAFARLFFEQNLLLVTIEYAFSRAIVSVCLKDFLVIAYQIVLLSLYYFSKEFVKRKKPILIAFTFLCFSELLELYFSFSSLISTLLCLAGFVGLIAIFLFFITFFKCYKNKFVLFRFSQNDYLMLSVMILLLSLGLFGIGFVEKYLSYFVLVFALMIFVKVLPADKFFICALIGALGAVIATSKVEFIIFAVLLSVVLIQFKELGKYYFALVSFFVVALLVFIFKIYGVVQISLISLALLLFLCLPQKCFEFLSSLFVFDGQNLIIQFAQQKRINEVKVKLELMSDTFSAMQRDFKYLLIGKIDREKASEELSQDIIKKCCLTCENYRTCYMENINKKHMFDTLVLRAIDAGQISLADMSRGTEYYCTKSNIAVSEINQTAKMFLTYEKTMKNEDTSKLIIASELGNFADIFKNFAEKLKSGISPNSKISKQLKERFLNQLVDVKEAVIFENEKGLESVLVIAPNEQILKREIPEVIFRVTKNKVKLKNVNHLQKSGLAIAEFVSQPKIKIEFAISSKAKEQKNGDNVIVTRISENRFFVAIADGMGHGNEANRISSMVLSLVRSMFEVGLDDGLILESVNKLLLPAGLDNFTTLDACVIDTEENYANFIKLGSSVSVIKHKQTSEIISCKSLPIGIVQNIKPTITKKFISPGDMIFLASDGVVDAFSSVGDFKCFVNDSKIFNLQKFVDDVVSDSELNSKHIDDMTIIGINLLKK